MTELEARDYRRILDLLYEIEDSPNLVSFATRLLAGLRRLIPGEIAGYTEVGPDSSPGFVDPPDARFPGIEEAFSRLAHQNPLVTHFQRTRDGRAFQIRDFMTREEWLDTDIYKEIYKRLGVEQQMAVGLATSTGTIVGVTIHRAGPDPFTEQEREMLTVLCRHLSHAHAVAMRNQGTKNAVLPVKHLMDMDLTPREAEVVRWVALGNQNSEIAELLDISPRTVQKHLQRIYDKLGVDRRTAAAAVVLGADPDALTSDI